MSVREAHQVFSRENPELKIGKSKFAGFRPSYVLPLDETPRNVCVCTIHANFIR
jgi:hypothetical protein